MTGRPGSGPELVHRVLTLLLCGLLFGLLQPSPVQAAAAELPVEVSFRITNIHRLQLREKTFLSEGSYRLAWGPELQALVAAQRLDPARLVRFANLVEPWNSLLEPVGPVATDPAGGRFVQEFRYAGLFYRNDLNLRRFPFGPLHLELVLEVPSGAAPPGPAAVVLRPMAGHQGLTGVGASINGYELIGSSLTASPPGGQAVEGGPAGIGPSSGVVEQPGGSQVTARIDYRANAWSAFVKWILPLAVVMATVLLAPSLDAAKGDLAFALPSTALLTMVFLQQAYKAEIPSTPYLTFLDQLYAFSYLVAIAVFVMFVWASNRWVGQEPAAGSPHRRRINRVATAVQLAALAGYGAIALRELIA